MSLTPPSLTSLISNLIDARLVFLARAAARHTLVDAGVLDLDDAIAGLLAGDHCPLCGCCSMAAQWEHTHPPLKYRRGHR
jgi:hypothetical protein